MNEPTAIERLYSEFENNACGECEESAESKAAYNRCEAEFAKFKPNPTIEEQNDIFDAIVNFGAVKQREGFVDGFKLAVKLMGEAYSESGTRTIPPDTLSAKPN